MKTELSRYQEMGRNAGCAHKLVMSGDELARPIAADIFRRLWERLDREDALDRYNAKQHFNGAFGSVYHGLPAVPPEAPAPRDRSQDYMLSTAERAALDKPQPAPAPSASAAVACAAFYAKVGV